MDPARRPIEEQEMRRKHLTVVALAAMILQLLTACRGREASMRVAAGEKGAIAQLRSLSSAEAAYNSLNNHFACTIAELATSPGLIDREMSTGRKDGYVYSVHCAPQIGLRGYQAWASPLEAGESGVNLYCTDQTGVVRRADHLMDACNEAKPVE